MEQKQLPLTNGAEAPRRPRHSYWMKRVDHEQMMLGIAEVFARKPHGFTIVDVQRFYVLNGKEPSNTFVGKLLNRMIAEKLIVRDGTDGRRNRLYRIVKSETSAASTSGPPKNQPAVPTAKVSSTPVAIGLTTTEAEQALVLLEAAGEDTTLARAGLARLRASEIKARLEALAK